MLAQVLDDIKCEITEIELSHLGEEEEEMQPDWLEVRDDTQVSLVMDSGFLQEVAEVMDDMDKSGQCFTDVANIFESKSIKRTLLHVDIEQMEVE